MVPSGAACKPQGGVETPGGFVDEFSPASRKNDHNDQPKRSCTSGVCLSTRVLMSKRKMWPQKLRIP